MKADAHVRVRPGRALFFSPQWSGEGVTVLFDSNSGDYWIINEAARKFVEAIVAAEPHPFSALMQQVPPPSVTPALSPSDCDEFDTTLDELVRAGILSVIEYPR